MTLCCISLPRLVELCCPVFSSPPCPCRPYGHYVIIATSFVYCWKSLHRFSIGLFDFAVVVMLTVMFPLGLFVIYDTAPCGGLSSRRLGLALNGFVSPIVRFPVFAGAVHTVSVVCFWRFKRSSWIDFSSFVHCSRCPVPSIPNSSVIIY